MRVVVRDGRSSQSQWHLNCDSIGVRGGHLIVGIGISTGALVVSDMGAETPIPYDVKHVYAPGDWSSASIEEDPQAKTRNEVRAEHGVPLDADGGHNFEKVFGAGKPLTTELPPVIVKLKADVSEFLESLKRIIEAFDV